MRRKKHINNNNNNNNKSDKKSHQRCTTANSRSTSNNAKRSYQFQWLTISSLLLLVLLLQLLYVQACCRLQIYMAVSRRYRQLVRTNTKAILLPPTFPPSSSVWLIQCTVIYHYSRYTRSLLAWRTAITAKLAIAAVHARGLQFSLKLKKKNFFSIEC